MSEAKARRVFGTVCAGLAIALAALGCGSGETAPPPASGPPAVRGALASPGKPPCGDTLPSIPGCRPGLPASPSPTSFDKLWRQDLTISTFLVSQSEASNRGPLGWDPTGGWDETLRSMTPGGPLVTQCLRSSAGFEVLLAGMLNGHHIRFGLDFYPGAQGKYSHHDVNGHFVAVHIWLDDLVPAWYLGSPTWLPEDQFATIAPDGHSGTVDASAFRPDYYLGLRVRGGWQCGSVVSA